MVAPRICASIPYRHVAAITLLVLSISAAWCTGQSIVQRKRAARDEQKSNSAEAEARALNAEAALSEVCVAGREWK